MKYLNDDNLDAKLQDAIEGFIADYVEKGFLDDLMIYKDDKVVDVLIERLFKCSYDFGEYVEYGEYVENCNIVLI